MRDEARSKKKPYWAKRHLIVKIKNPQSPHNGKKAEVRDDYEKEQIRVRLLNDGGKDLIMKEDELEKVLPNVGGTVMVIYSRKIGIVKMIDEANKEMLIKLADENRELRVKFKDLCKW